MTEIESWWYSPADQKKVSQFGNPDFDKPFKPIIKSAEELKREKARRAKIHLAKRKTIQWPH